MLRLQDLKRQHPKVLQEMIMDIIRVLSSPNLDIRKKTLDIMLDLVVPKNIDEVMQVLRMDVARLNWPRTLIEEQQLPRQLLANSAQAHRHTLASSLSMQVLKKEVQRTSSEDGEKNTECRALRAHKHC